MIELNRIRTKGHIPAPFRDPKRAKRNAALIADFRATKMKLEGSMWSKAKRALKKESGGKCSYCEAPADATAHCDVEHFRPKAHYWWLALCYDNYLFACQICNQIYKKDNFPISAAKMPEPVFPDEITEGDLGGIASALFPDPLDFSTRRRNFEGECRDELAHLIDPYTENPELWFAWEADPVLKEVRLVPRHPGNTRCKEIVAAAEQYLGLNREELRQWRFRVYSLIDPLAETIRVDGPPISLKAKAGAALSEAMSGGAIFAGMVRYFVREVWKLPLPVPT